MLFMNFKHNLFIALLLALFILMMNSNNVFIQWIIMEFSTIISISLINIKSPNKIPSLIYYVVSVISSIFLFLFIIMYLSSLDFTKSDQFNFLIQLLFFLKIGIFPFHFWMIYSYEMMNWKQIFLMSTLIKFIPIYMFVSLTYINLWSLTYLVLSNLFIAFYTNKFYSLKKLLACSTIFNSMYFIMLLNLNKTAFIIFIIIYVINYYMLISFLNKSNIHNFNYSFVNEYQFYTFMILMINYSMLPILLTFVIKWNLINMMVSMKTFNWILFIILFSSMMMIWNYLIILKNLFMKMNFYKNNFMDDKKYFVYSLFALTFMSANVSLFLTFNFM
uniref:NADH-ubiquinone oxidoreductase chain 2 n=1 Tax=Apis nuluensis TaxID=96030 RepID=A0A343L9S5_9HYME|nr:NADH dehydrogenase subunit 2 [Apis nuluensis]ATN28902.1 NADH dehydrogenase subunit 2 [Apis nuluensis]BBC20691.1 NADH dehydrogenase subunit 2 [Apis nuluensis]